MSQEEALKELYRSAFEWTAGQVVKRLRDRAVFEQALELSRGSGLPIYCLGWRVGITDFQFQVVPYFSNPLVFLGDPEGGEGDLRTLVLDRCLAPLFRGDPAALAEFEEYRSLSVAEQVELNRKAETNFSNERPSPLHWAKRAAWWANRSSKQDLPWEGFVQRVAVIWSLQHSEGPYPIDPGVLQASVEEFNAVLNEWVLERL